MAHGTLDIAWFALFLIRHFTVVAAARQHITAFCAAAPRIAYLCSSALQRAARGSGFTCCCCVSSLPRTCHLPCCDNTGCHSALYLRLLITFTAMPPHHASAEHIRTYRRLRVGWFPSQARHRHRATAGKVDNFSQVCSCRTCRAAWFLRVYAVTLLAAPALPRTCAFAPSGHRVAFGCANAYDWLVYLSSSSAATRCLPPLRMLVCRAMSVRYLFA
jgi:hypothetical protein